METSEQAAEDFFRFAPPFSESNPDPQENERRAAQKAAYFSAVSSFQALCLKLKSSQAKVDGNSIKFMIEQMIAFVKEDERMLLGLANAPYPFIINNLGQKVYGIIVIHGINVLIYSLKIAIDLGL